MSEEEAFLRKCTEFSRNIESAERIEDKIQILEKFLPYIEGVFDTMQGTAGTIGIIYFQVLHLLKGLLITRMQTSRKLIDLDNRVKRLEDAMA